MADSKISALPAATVALAGTEVLPIVQSSTTKQVSVANLTAGRAISATQLTLTTGSLIVASGQGVDFSATSSGSGTMTSELFNDYEEGTWTPALSRLGSAPSLTYTTQAGFYTKVGDVVTVTGTVTIDAIASAGSTFNVLTGFPFSAGTTGYNGGLTCLVSSAVLVDPVLVFAPYNTEFRMRTLALILTGGAMQVDYVAGGTFTFSGSYII
jgi:hypothetical protein